MLYHLLVPLARDHILFNVFRYLTFRSLMALITALVISLVVGPWLVRRLRAVQNGGETIREDTPGAPSPEEGHADHGGRPHRGRHRRLHPAVGEPPQPLRLGGRC